MPAVLFGSIGTLADTSELQRDAFNRAFAAAGLDWHWDQEDYARMLQDSGGQPRITAFAEAVGDTVDAAALHRAKSEIFQERLAAEAVAPRPGVVETIAACRRDGYQVALVTTTSRENLDALAKALRPHLDLEAFDLVVDRSEVEHPKPEPDVYRHALQRLGADTDGSVAIEDNVGGVASAVSAGLTCVAFPGENNAAHNFDQASHRVDQLSFTELQTLAASH
jgi:HAD superfamily hydrolase (TIGR01509 family)